MPYEIWAIDKTWVGNPKSKVMHRVHCIDADDSPRGVKYTNTEKLIEAIEGMKNSLPKWDKRKNQALDDVIKLLRSGKADSDVNTNGGEE